MSQKNKIIVLGKLLGISLIILMILIGLFIIKLTNLSLKVEKEKSIPIRQILISTLVTDKQEEIKTTSRSGGTVDRTVKKNTNLTINSDLRVISNLTATDFDKMLKGTNLHGLGKSLEQAEKEYGINGLYLMGLCCLESGYGKSTFAKERNNLVGWNAVDSNSSKAKYFKSKNECVLYVAKKLKNNYLSKSRKVFQWLFC